MNFKEENNKLKKENKTLLNALKDANSLLTEKCEPFELDRPKYWSISKILEERGYNVNGFENHFR